MTRTSDAKRKACNLHIALANLLSHYEQLIKDTNSEPTFGEDEAAELARKALFENRPLADWEPDPLATAAPDLLAAAKEVLAGLNARIDAAPLESVPVFNGITTLSDAIAKAEGRP